MLIFKATIEDIIPRQIVEIGTISQQRNVMANSIAINNQGIYNRLRDLKDYYNSSLRECDEKMYKEFSSLASTINEIILPHRIAIMKSTTSVGYNPYNMEPFILKEI